MPERFKIVRESFNLSQKDMARALDISLPAIQGYEAGRSVPGGNVLEAFVKLGINANWLLMGLGEMKLSDKPEVAPPISKETHTEADQYLRNCGIPAGHTWFHQWIEEELQGKSISEVMAVVVKFKTVLDAHKNGG